MKTTYLTEKEFKELGEYSCSLPTGTTLGRRWKRDRYAFARGREKKGERLEEWFMGEYVPDPDPKMIGINWTKIVVVEGKMDPDLQRKIDAFEERMRA